LRLPMGAGCTSNRPRTIRGVTISKDVELQKFLDGWRDLGVSFTSVSLLAESKDSAEAYDRDANRWTTEKRCSGQTALVLKTTGDGWLRMHVSMSGFRWDHIGNYRSIGKLDPNGPNGLVLKVVETAERRFDVDALKAWLECQTRYVYSDEAISSDNVARINSDGQFGRAKANGRTQRNVELLECAQFAKGLYQSLTESDPEGTRNNARGKEAENMHKSLHPEREGKSKSAAPAVPYGYETGCRLAQHAVLHSPQPDLSARPA